MTWGDPEKLKDLRRYGVKVTFQKEGGENVTYTLKGPRGTEITLPIVNGKAELDIAAYWAVNVYYASGKGPK